MEFLQVDTFADHKAFKKLIINPMSFNDGNSLQPLKLLFQGIAIRRTKASVMQELDLPPRDLKEELVELEPEERDLYELIMKAGSILMSNKKKHSPMQVILKLRQIANHGRDLLPEEVLRNVDSLGLGALIDLSSNACEACGITVKQENAEEQLASVECAHQICTKCASKTTSQTLMGANCPLCSGDSVSTLSKRGKQTSEHCYKPSSKVKMLLNNLESDKTDARDGNKPRKRYVRTTAVPVT